MGAIDVGREGKFYTLNGEVVRPNKFYGIGGFKFPNHIWGWITAGKGTPTSGGKHLSNAKRYIEKEVLGNGCRRMRSPLELTLWTGPYFDVSDQAPIPWRGHSNIANTLELMNLRAGTGSAFSLTPGMKKLIRMYVVLAREFDIVIEIPVLWTIKSEAKGGAAKRLGFDSDPPDPRMRFTRTPFEANGGSEHGVALWNEHVLAEHGVGAYLHRLRNDGDGDGPHRVDPGGLNLIVDAMNERTAHVPEIWNEKVLKSVARRWNEREQPGAPLLISESGRADRYGAPLETSAGLSGYLGVAKHTPRSGDWDMAGDVLRSTWPKELIDSNESNMGWTQEQRAAWVRLIPKWEGLGTTDRRRWRNMHQNYVENDVYTTFHTLRAMDGGWPDTPQTPVEEDIRDITGASKLDPPPPPPDPPDPPDPPSGAKLIVTPPDKNGVRSMRVEFPEIWPRVVPGVAPEDAVTEIHDIDLPEEYTFYAAGSFIGLDRGDIGEFAVVIAARGGPEIYSRSFHKETAAPFDSEDWKRTAFVTTNKLRIWIVARTTGANEILRRGEPWSSRPDFVIRLWTHTDHHS